jgi:hypothetical protein
MSKHTHRRTRRAAVAAAGLAALATAAPACALTSAATAGVAPAAVAPAAPPAVSASEIAATHGNENMVQSQGNLYWTADTGASCSRCWAAVYRTGKRSQPGQELVLYRESSAQPVQFGDLNYAQVGGTYYGYFVANYPATHTSLIKRVPLAGGAAVTIATSPRYIGSDDLVNDGSFLYWADAGAIRRVAIGGGTIQKIVNSTILSRIRVLGGKLYFSNGDRVGVTNVTGSTPTVIGTADATVTALDVAATAKANGTEVAFGSSRGSVYDKTGEMTTAVQSGFVPNKSPLTSISVDAATADIGFTINDAADHESYLDDWQVNPSTGLVSTGTDELTLPGAQNIQLDDAGGVNGNNAYFTTATGVFKLAV